MFTVTICLLPLLCLLQLYIYVAQCEFTATIMFTALQWHGVRFISVGSWAPAI